MTGRTAVMAMLAGLLAACGGSAAGAPELDGAWRLEAGSHGDRTVPIVEGSPITLTVAGKTIEGTAACNGYGGTIEQDGTSVRVVVASMTEMACAEPVMASEAAYVDALADVTTAARDGGRLVLSGAGVELELTLLPPIPTAELVGTTWTLASLIEGETVSSVTGEPATLRLDDDGRITGSTGCRSFSGTYRVSGDEVQITALSTGPETCPDELAAQDTHVLDVLGDGFTAQIDGNRLTVSHGPSGLGYLGDDGQ